MRTLMRPLMRPLMRAIAVIMTTLGLLAACGGGGGGGSAPAGSGNGAGSGGSDAGGGSNPPSTEPFGLDERKPLARLSLPTQSPAPSSYELTASFPALSFDSPIFIAGVPGQDRLVVVEQSGRVRAFDYDRSASTTRVVLDLSRQILTGGEQGLLGLAFDPDFEANGYLYVHYSAGGPRRSVIARFSWDSAADLASLASEKIILEVAQPFSNHNGGMVAFGPDDYLYIAFGDGGSGGDPQNNAQNPNNLLGSILRIDVHPANAADPYDVPADNPFLGQAGFRPETYAYGLRNPYRFSFDRQTGDLWLGDVGQNEREEINLVRAGDNLGWRVFEGNLPFNDSGNDLPASAFTPPIIDYDHGQGVAVIGGYVYRGPSNPGLVGRYLYTDFLSGPVWALSVASGTVVANDVVTTTTGNSTSFGEGNDGELYLLVGSTVQHFVEAVSSGGSVPDQLSETGIFTSMGDLTPASGLIEYLVAAPFWSDGASKRRFIAIPDGSTIGFESDASWGFPLGTLTVKHFEIELEEGLGSSLKRLETRLLVRTTTGWQGFTYRWRADGSDADLLAGRETELLSIIEAGGGSRQQRYEYPSRTDCLTCHNEAAGFALGVRARQLNTEFPYAAATDNQLRAWNNIGLFDQDIGAVENLSTIVDPADSGAPLAERARSYLEVNCAPCHQPGGGTPVALDLRLETPLAGTGTVDELPQAGDLGLVDARIIAPGDAARSVLLERMRRLGGERMPPVSSHRVDEASVELMAAWIDSL